MAEKKQNEIYNAIETMPAYGAKAKWAEMWCNSQHTSFTKQMSHHLFCCGRHTFPVHSVPSVGLSNAVYSLAYVS
jgi:hypothetical protein